MQSRQLIFKIITWSCIFFPFVSAGQVNSANEKVVTGAMQMGEYLPLLNNQRIAVVANPTSVIGKTHLVDSLVALKVNIKKIFAPEHGFRGQEEAGATVSNTKDAKTGVEVISLYGQHNKPTAEDLSGVDLVIFDIQDVGARFYTYISTLQLVMEACAENKKTLLILDRPNPNGFYVDGPVLDKKFSSFVGMNTIPVVYGLTIAEYALMLNGEHWLKDSLQCHLKYVALKNYDHKTYYELPVKPSPNLPNMTAVYLYPSLCMFEGTAVSVGRGTDKPFQVIGCPDFKEGAYTFIPKSIPGVANNPPFLGMVCKGFDLREFGDIYIKNLKQLYLFWLQSMYESSPNKEHFFNDFFDKLAGTDELRKQIIAGKTEPEIRKSWEKDLNHFKEIRKKYLLYKDFE